MKIGIPKREIIAWMVLSLAIVLFSVTIAFAQTKRVQVENKDGKVHIEIKKTENGKTVNLDTTFEAGNDVDVDKIIEDFTGEKDEHVSESTPDSHAKDKNSHRTRKQVFIKDYVFDLDEADKDHIKNELNESMKDLREGLNKMSRSLREMHIHIDDNGEDETNFDFNFDRPDKDFDKEPQKDCHNYKFKIIHSEDGEIDSLSDDNHFVIKGEQDEAAPTLEKIVKTKNGKQVFVYKRSVPSEDSNKNSFDKKGESNDAGLNGITDLRLFPNPTSNKINMEFNVNEKKDISIEILDANKKKIFSEKLQGYQGEYSKEVDLDGKSKGNYIVKITTGKNSIVRKFILN